jgi:hypothetical protein
MAATPLCEIMGRHGSDKGHTNLTNSWHTYTPYYHTLFEGLRDHPLRVFELGLGTNHTDVPSNMGPNGKPGASLYGWREYFPLAVIHGADIDRRILFEADRIRTVYCDQTDPQAIREMWRTLDPAKQGYDIIVEDGLHTFEANVCFFEHSADRLRVGGYYIIEDALGTSKGRYLEKLIEWGTAYPNYQFEWVPLLSARNPFDNNLVVIRRLL